MYINFYFKNEEIKFHWFSICYKNGPSISAHFHESQTSVKTQGLEEKRRASIPQLEGGRYWLILFFSMHYSLTMPGQMGFLIILPNLHQTNCHKIESTLNDSCRNLDWSWNQWYKRSEWQGSVRQTLGALTLSDHIMKQKRYRCNQSRQELSHNARN